MRLSRPLSTFGFLLHGLARFLKILAKALHGATGDKGKSRTEECATQENTELSSSILSGIAAEAPNLPHVLNQRKPAVNLLKLP